MLRPFTKGFLAFAMCLSAIGTCRTSAIEETFRLQNDLFRKYNTSIRPVYNQTEAVLVREERKQQFAFSAWFDLEWHDDLLTWNKSEYEEVDHLLLRSDLIWKPDIAVTNSFDDLSDFISDDNLVRVSHDGHVHWMPGHFFRTYCQVDVTYYPFDAQTCNITLATWMSSEAEVDLWPEYVNSDLCQPSVEWVLKEPPGMDRVRHLYQPNADAPVTVSVTFNLLLTRRKTYYVLNVILPVLMFAFLNVVGFVLPPKSGEKVTVSASVFLSFSFFISLLNDSMPRTSASTPILGIYLLVVMGMGAASVCLSAITIAVHTKAKAQVNDHKMTPPARDRKRKLRKAMSKVYRIEDLNEGHHQSSGDFRIDPESVLIAMATVKGYSNEDVQRLQTDLFTNYTKHVRPVKNQSHAITVGVNVYLMYIHQLDEKEQEFSFSAWLYMEWSDDFLQWDPAMYNGVSSILVAPTQVWRPDIAISNSYERMTKYKTGDYLARLDYDGMVEWSPGDVFHTHCTVDITLYPFDTQTCTIMMGTWMYDVSEVDVVPLGNVSLADYDESGEWDVISTKSQRTEQSFECCPGESTVMVEFSMILSRRKTFYVLTVIIPVLLFSFLNVVDFVLPPESGEKMSLAVTVFLSFAFFMSILNESMPRTSLSFSILGIYMIFVMGMGTLSVLLSAIVIMIHHRVKGQLQASDVTSSQQPRGSASINRPANPPDFLPGIEQFDNLSEKLNGTFETFSQSDDESLKMDSARGSERQTQANASANTEASVSSFARRCDRFFLWFSLALTICGATVVMSLLTYN
ncbi:neuronal acetylcholine receptor subunit beta-3-like [Liolophura sinensis]|uniref:neuronal acetylcholine receptor subunit beta-3-like n=1 Tax=Liolophura sinensis TaxID=3198878 RepID=UPI00315986D7